MVDKQPSTIKELANLSTELTMKVDSTKCNIKTELEGMSHLMAFMNEGFEKFKVTMTNAPKKKTSIL